ncbi:MAG TPA: DUF2490 domain-containing protein [Sphingomicrobium sp.]|nr:DUF2490 domain-containing protein [Sphingomicrobium sp.]
MNSLLSRAGAAALFSAMLAGAAHAREDEQLWTSANAAVTLAGDLRLTQEATARFSNKRKGLYEIEGVTLLGYKLGKSVTVAAGYVHNPQYSGGDFTVMERRAREQVTFDNLAKLGAGKLSARMRLEQRWRENVDGTAWRARPYVKYSLPLRKGGKTALTLSNETFVNLQNTSFQRSEGLDRMRNLIAISTPLAKGLSVEAGYLNQYGFVRGGDDSVDHALSVSLGLSL